jgi:hypothetical protein
MDLNQAGTEQPGRMESFSQGSGGNPYRVATSLGQDSAAYMREIGNGFTPESVLNSTVHSGNGESASDYSSRTLSNGAMLPTGNGEDQQTQQGIARILLDGMRQVGTL